jgi:hypothetical protein
MARKPGIAASFARRLSRALRNLHVADLVVLALIGGGVLDTSATLLAAPNPIVQSVVVFAFSAAAAKRLLAWRHGTRRTISLQGASQTITIVVAAAPWFLLPLLRQPFQNWLQSAPLAFPLPLRVVGACLMMSGVLGPFWLALRASSAPARVNEVRFSPHHVDS